MNTLITKENQIFLINKETQNGAVAMSYMTNGLLRKPFLIYDLFILKRSGLTGCIINEERKYK
jgi:hypothetical protein